MEKISKKNLFAGFKFVGDGREVLRQWMADARCRTGEGTRPLIISGPMASGKTTLIRRIAEYYSGLTFNSRFTDGELSFVWKYLDSGGLCAFDDWRGRGAMHNFLDNVFYGATHRCRRPYSTFEVDEYRPNGRVVVAVSARARISEFPYLQSRCAFVQLQNRTTGRPASPARLVVARSERR